MYGLIAKTQLVKRIGILIAVYPIKPKLLKCVCHADSRFSEIVNKTKSRAFSGVFERNLVPDHGKKLETLSANGN